MLCGRSPGSLHDPATVEPHDVVSAVIGFISVLVLDAHRRARRLRGHLRKCYNMGHTQVIRPYGHTPVAAFSDSDRQ